MKTVSVRVPDELKRRMEEMSWINWSEILRKAIIEAINKHKKFNIANAILINEKVRKDAPKQWDSTMIIRNWRKRDE